MKLADNHHGEHRPPEARVQEGGDLDHRRGDNRWPLGPTAAYTSSVVGEYLEG